MKQLSKNLAEALTSSCMTRPASPLKESKKPIVYSSSAYTLVVAIIAYIASVLWRLGKGTTLCIVLINSLSFVNNL